MSLSDAQRTHLEHRLLAERERVTTALARLGRQFGRTAQEADGGLTTLPHHPADLGTDEIDRQVDAEEETRIGGELAEIDAALARLYRDPARFGRDERTGDAVPFERLDLIPWARRQVDGRDAP